MDIGTVGAQAQTQSNNGKVEDKNNMGQDQFLQLLVAQMQNQDPINPMDSKEFASQLAQFNSVEQLISVNNGLSTLQNSQEMMRVELTNSMASSLTGKHVKAMSNQISLKSGQDANIQYELENTADEVDIIVKDASGSQIRRASVGAAGAGESSWSWDGKNSDGHPVPEGKYSIEIEAANGGETVKAQMYTEGIANQVRFTGNGVLISIDGVEIPISNIETVGRGSNQ